MSITFLSILFLLPIVLFLLTNLPISPFRHFSTVTKIIQGSVLLTITGSAIGIFSLIYFGPTEINYFSVEELGLTIRVDPLSMIMYSMIAVIAFVVVRFSKNYLDGEPNIHSFFRRLAFTLAFVQLLVISGNIATIFVAWVGTSIGLHSLLRFYPNRKKAMLAGRKKFIVARIGDVSLLSAFLLIYLEFNSGNLTYIFGQLASLSPSELSFNLELSAILIVFSAALKSVQVPFHGWLLDVMEAPTPVSALLHAGLLNAGPFLIIRFASLLNIANSASYILITVGALSALFGAIVATTQPSIKTSLAYSSIGHMGFTLMVSGFGVYSASLLHLVAHSFYKAHAFLSSGSVIEKVQTKYASEFTRLRKAGRMIVGTIVAVLLYTFIAFFWGIDQTSPFQLLAIGGIIFLGILSMQINSFDSSNNGRSIIALIIGSGVVINLFFFLERIVQLTIGTQVPGIRNADVNLIAIISVVLLLFLMTVLMQLTFAQLRTGKYAKHLGIHLKNGLYFNLLFDKMMNSLSIKSENNAH